MDDTRVNSTPGCLEGSHEPLLSGSADYAAKEPPSRFSNIRSVLIVCGLVGIFFSNSMSNGLVVVGLPYIVSDLRVPNHLLLWYAQALSPIIIPLRSIAKNKPGRRFHRRMLHPSFASRRRPKIANHNPFIADYRTHAFF